MKHIVWTKLSHDMTWQGLVLNSFCKDLQKYGAIPNITIYLILVLAQDIHFAMQLSGNILEN